MSAHPAGHPKERLLRTKLFIPRPHPERVERSALTTRLSGCLQRKLALICAPAGFGKSTLLSDWLARSRLPAAWVSLDAGDNDPARFWAYFVAALQTVHAQRGEVALAMLQSPQPPPTETILTELLNDIAQAPEDFIQVLDDYHAIDNPAIHSALDFFIEHQPEQMHLIIASRSEPPLALPLLRARRELLELHLDDLRFSRSEASTFLNQVMGLDLSSEEVQTLEEATEGWVAGLQLAGLSLQGAQDSHGILHSFSGSHRYIFDYLAQEVLKRQPAHTRDFLLRTSILERLHAGLCEAVFKAEGAADTSLSPLSPIPSSLNSQSILEGLERANLFIVPLDQQRQWYRYHHLFSDFLRACLEQEQDPAQIADLHLRASQWYGNHGLIGEAVTHALAGKQPDQAARWVKQAAKDMFESSELITLRQWLGAFPASTLRRDPALNMLYIWALVATGHSDQVESRLQEVEASLGVLADGSPASADYPPSLRGALAEIASLRATLAFNRFDIAEVTRQCQMATGYMTSDMQDGLFQSHLSLLSVIGFNQALAYEVSGDVVRASQAFDEVIRLSQQDQNKHLLPMAISHQAALQIIQGRLRQAAAIYQQALQDVERAERPSPLAGMVYTGIGSLYCEWNQFEQAQAYLGRGIEMGRQWSQWESLQSGYFGQARCQAARGDVQAASATLKELEELNKKLDLPWTLSTVKATQALLAARRADLETAAAWADSGSINPQAEIHPIQEGEAIILARVLTSLGRVEQAIDLARRILLQAEQGQRWGRAIEARVALTVALMAQGEREPAIQVLEDALRQALPEGYLRTFLDEEPQLPIEDCKIKIEKKDPLAAEDHPLLAYIDTLLAARSEPTQPRQPSRPVAPLTFAHPLLSGRELEVLRLMADGLTNQQIANQLYISLNTVKTHVKNIHAHLEAGNRTQAAARARELGLI